MRNKLIVLYLLIPFTIYANNNWYYQTARSLYKINSPFGEILSTPFTWIGNISEKRIIGFDLIKKRLEPPHLVNGKILFQFETPSAKMVTLAGDFPDNLWGGTGGSNKTYDSHIDPLFDDGTHGDKVAGDGIWSLVKKIEPGRYQYKFVIDRNSWFSDPNALETIDDGYGGKNSVIVVK
ncbi:MAG: hypothetical protein K8S23_02420 [Candidatus Cloacimonetes bacterium]|nr:hypothetical protein [Candidatus Cloacimonadota bacterium]